MSNSFPLWTFEVTGQPAETRHLFDLVVATLSDFPEGPAYMQGPAKSEPHAKMVTLLTAELAARELPDETIEAAAAMLDHIQKNGVTWGWFRSAPKARAIVVRCDRSWLPEATPDRIESFHELEDAIPAFLAASEHTSLAKLGCIVALLVTRCAVIQRASLDACMVALKKPVMATKSWWYLNIQHHSGKNQPLEHRRIYLEPVTAAVIMRWHEDIRGQLTNTDTRGQQRAIAKRAFKAFARSASLPADFQVETATDAALGWLATVLPGFLMSTVTRRRTTHALPEAVWRRLQEVAPKALPERAPHIAYSDPTQAPPGVHDIAPIRPLLDLLDGTADAEDLSWLPERLADCPPPLQMLGEWLPLKTGSRKTARALLLLVGMEILAALEGRTPPLSGEDLGEMRAVISEDLRSNEVLDLASSFVDWLATSSWACASLDLDEDEEKPGVSVNIISPAELQNLLELLQNPDCGIPDPQLRDIIRTIFQLGCVGMRRAEALKLRSTDVKAAPEMLNDYPLLHLVPYPERGLKSVSSKRYVPAKLLHPALQVSILAAATRPADEMLIEAYQATHLSDQTIWLTANRALQQYLQDPGLHLHHCRHTAATHFLLQLMAAPLGLHRYWGRCHYLDSLLAGADEVANTLTFSNPASLSHLWAVSMLLGHLSPLISLKTYIHCCDWLTYFALDRSGEAGYSELLALASGRPLSTVKKHQQLDDSARQHLSQRSLPTLDQRTSDGWSLLHQVEKEYPKSVSRDDTPLVHAKARQQQGPTFANLSELMTHLAHRPSPEEAAILQAAAYLSGASEQTDQGTPDLPCLRAGLMASTAEDWTKRLHKAFLELAPEEIESWKSALEMLAGDIDTHRSLIRVRKAPGTEAMIDVLKRMGFMVRDWCFRPPQERGGPVPEFRSFRRWSDALLSGLPLHLRPAQIAKGFSYEGARWAVVGHLLYLRLRC